MNDNPDSNLESQAAVNAPDRPPIYESDVRSITNIALDSRLNGSDLTQSRPVEDSTEADPQMSISPEIAAKEIPQWEDMQQSMASPGMLASSHENDPIISVGTDRCDAIIREQPGKFQLKDNPQVSGDEPWYEISGFSQVNKHEALINHYAEMHGVDPDFAKAIVYVETTHGYYDQIAGDSAKSIQPMNVHAEYWKDLGYSRDELGQPDKNIEAGTKILSELWERTENPTISKVATLYNNLSADYVSDYGKRVERVYWDKPWAK